MKTYIVKYSFSGTGECILDAKSQKDAEKKFYDGDYDAGNDTESGQGYDIDSVELYDDNEDVKQDKIDKATMSDLDYANSRG